MNRDIVFVGDAPIAHPFWRDQYHPLAREWVDRIDLGESIHWSAQATLAADGIAAWNGPHAGTLALYSEVRAVECDTNAATIRLINGEAYVSIPANHAHYAAGLHAILELLWRTHIGDPDVA
jgi:hypothetical protein